MFNRDFSLVPVLAISQVLTPGESEPGGRIRQTRDIGRADIIMSIVVLSLTSI